jgi:hypothetical protein
MVGSRCGVETFRFFDGTEWSFTELISKLPVGEPLSENRWPTLEGVKGFQVGDGSSLTTARVDALVAAMASSSIGVFGGAPSYALSVPPSVRSYEMMQ